MHVLTTKTATIRNNNVLMNPKRRNNAFIVQSPADSSVAGSFNLPGETSQPRLAISDPGDPLEQEADRLASQVVQPDQPLAPVDLQDHQDLVGRRQSSTNWHSGNGNELGVADRGYFEARLNHDFSRVRVHVDGEAGESARNLHARAVTLGDQIYFAPGQYQPGTIPGRRLLAHELAHVVQQDRIGFQEPSLFQRTPDDGKPGSAAQPQPVKQKTLKQEGVGATDPVAGKTAGLIDAVLQRNKRLAPYIGDRLKQGFKVDEKGKFVKDLSDGIFDDSYRKAYNLNSADPVGTDILGFYDPKKSEVHLRPGAEFGTAFHEAVHRLASPNLYTTFLQLAIKISSDLAEVLKEGVTALFADSILNDEGLPDLIDSYRKLKKKAEKIETGLGSDGFDVLAEFNFKGTNIGKIGERLGVTSKDFPKVGIKGVLGKVNQLI